MTKALELALLWASTMNPNRLIPPQTSIFLNFYYLSAFKIFTTFIINKKKRTRDEWPIQKIKNIDTALSLAVSNAVSFGNWLQMFRDRVKPNNLTS